MTDLAFEKLVSLARSRRKNNKKRNDKLTVCYRVMINQQYVTKWKIYIKDESEKETKQLGGKISKSFINLKR